MSDERSRPLRASEKPAPTFLGRLLAMAARTFAETMAGIAIWSIVGFLIGGIVGWFMYGVPGAVLFGIVGGIACSMCYIAWKAPWTEF